MVAFLEINVSAQVKNSNPIHTFRQNIGTMYSPSYLIQKLSPEKFQMHHYFSTSFTFGGGQSILANAYMNRMTFQFAIPLKVQVDLGVMSFPYVNGNSYGSISNQLFGNVSMEYRPFKNMLIGLQLYKGPVMYYPYGTYTNGFRPADYFFNN